jgi:CheY-specific phosphatase CheX
VKLRMIADATGMGLLTTMLAGTSVFIRIGCVGATLGSSTYLLNIDTALKVAADPTPIEDADGLASIEWTFDGVYDATWAKVFNITINNTQATI